ncbi:MAG: hypothetical protein R2744_01180 [Bacteroidales bacterium]
MFGFAHEVADKDCGSKERIDSLVLQRLGEKTFSRCASCMIQCDK